MYTQCVTKPESDGRGNNIAVKQLETRCMY